MFVDILLIICVVRHSRMCNIEGFPMQKSQKCTSYAPILFHFFVLFWKGKFIPLQSVLKMCLHLSVRWDVMWLPCQWWNNVTELSQDDAPKESSSFLPAAASKVGPVPQEALMSKTKKKTSIEQAKHTDL